MADGEPVGLEETADAKRLLDDVRRRCVRRQRLGSLRGQREDDLDDEAPEQDRGADRVASPAAAQKGETEQGEERRARQ
jgi:hypothetical protein